MIRRLTRVLGVACLLFVVSAPLRAEQAGSARLEGRVVDPQGAAVASAKVVATHKATGLERGSATNADGRFSLSGLLPGEYEVRASAPGFAETILPAVSLSVGRDVSLAVALTVGGRDEKVTVEGTQLLNTTSGAVDGLITAEAIQDLPLNGRNFLELAFLTPGNAPAPNFDPTKTTTVSISSAGQLGRGGNLTVDGADQNDDIVGGSIQNISQEAVQEFQIATNRYSAELGRSAGSVVNVITRSGGDAVHGSASVFLRDGDWGALPATYDRSSGEAPPFDRQQYAAALGGPLVKGKLFGFGSVEYRNQDGGVLVGTRDLATRTIRRSFAEAPLDDVLGTGRLDWAASANDRVLARYSFQRVESTGASSLNRAIGSSSWRETGTNESHAVAGSWTRTLSSSAANTLRLSWSHFANDTVPVTPGIQRTYPSILDGASFRVPQATIQRRLQAADAVSFLRGNHSFKVGAEAQKVSGDLDLGVFREGRIEFVQDFAQFDLNHDGVVDDDDLLFAVTLRSATPERNLTVGHNDNTYLAFFAQDDWKIHPQLTLNIGLRYELDTDVKNVSRYGEINPLVQPFLVGDRSRDKNNFGPRVGFNWTTRDARTSLHGGYGIYHDRVTLEIMTLERGLDGRALAVEVRAGNALFFDPAQGGVPPFAPTPSNPFTGFILPGAGASGINIIDNRLQNPTVQQWNLGVQHQIGGDLVARADYIHDFGTHFIIGRTVGTVFNPVVGGPDRVVNLESSVNTHYDGLLVSVEKRFGAGTQLRASYTLAKAFNYANDDQIPFSYGPVDPEHLELEFGPTPNDQRHRFVLSGTIALPAGFRLSPIWTVASGVPMDIMMPDGSTRVPAFQRNAGARKFKSGAELNAFLTELNAAGGVKGVLLPLVGDDARFSDSFDSLDLRVSRSFKLGAMERRLELIAECFNVFNVTNILGVSTTNYSGFSNVLVRDSDDPRDPGYLRSSSFGRAVTTAGGVFGSGGPRAFQLGARITF
jgi:Carboxypeptidase regulatory-like domain/TonB dependent receptor-like, beta-barrel